MADKSNCKKCGDQLEFPINETPTLSIGGKDVGINCLDDIMNEVISLDLTDSERIKRELLDRVKDRDFVPPKAENEYGEALLKEYQRRI